MTVLLPLYCLASGVLLGAAVVLLAQHLRPMSNVKRPLSLIGTDAVTAQVPPSRATSDYPFKPFYPSPEEEASLGQKKPDNAPTHEPMEASRR